MLAVFFLTAVQAGPVLAGPPAWWAAVVDIADLRDKAILDLLDLVADYQEFLTTGPTAAAAASEGAEIQAEMGEVADEAFADIQSIMSDYPKAPQVQDAGAFAVNLVWLAQGYSVDEVTLAFDEYVAGLPGSGIPPSTTTTTLPSVTTTTLPSVTTTTLPSVTTTTLPSVTTTTLPSVTTTTLPPVTTTTLPPVTTTTRPVVTTTTLPPTTTTTRPVVTTTTTTTTRPPTTTTSAPAPATTTTTTAAALGGSGEAAQPPPLRSPVAPPGSISTFEGTSDALGSGEEAVPIGEPAARAESGISSSLLPDHGGFSASLSRILEPVLPATVADVVVSPLLIFELLWRAISSSGRGLVMPIALLFFSVISLLWDRRSNRSRAAAGGSRRLPVPVTR